MKTKELIELLQQADPESDVSFEMFSGCCGDVEFMSVIDTDIFKDEKIGSWVRVYFAPLPGYYSCIQVGSTIKNHNEYWTSHNKPEYTTDYKKEDK